MTTSTPPPDDMQDEDNHLHLNSLAKFAQKYRGSVSPERLPELSAKTINLIDRYLGGESGQEITTRLRFCSIQLCDCLTAWLGVVEGADANTLQEHHNLAQEIAHTGADLVEACEGLDPGTMNAFKLKVLEQREGGFNQWLVGVLGSTRERLVHVGRIAETWNGPKETANELSLQRQNGPRDPNS